MHTQNYHKGNSGLLNEYNRKMYKKMDSESKGLIDHTKTHLNYNLCPHEQYKPREITKIQEKIRGKKFAKNGNLFGTTIITLPKDYEGDVEKFFESAYKGLKKIYNLKDEDIVSAYVHMDETTPHMHFCFIPINHLEDKDVVSWEKLMTKDMFKTQHSKLSKIMEEDLGQKVSILNGETLGIDVTKMTKENKILSMENAQLQEEKENLETQKIYMEETIDTLKQEKDKIILEGLAKEKEVEKLKENVDELNSQIKEKTKEVSGLEAQILGFKAIVRSFLDKFHELKPKALKTHLGDIFKQRKMEASLRTCEKEEETIDSYLESNDLTSEIPLDSFGRFQRGVDKMEELLTQDEDWERE